MDYTRIMRLINKQSVAFLGSVDEHSSPYIKAVFSPRKRDGFKKFYFISSLSTLRCYQYLENDAACLYFYDRQYNNAVLFNGNMQITTDIDIKKEYWRNSDIVRFPNGVEDTDCCVLEFTTTYARYHFDSETADFDVNKAFLIKNEE